MAGKITVSTINDSSGVLATQNGMTGIAKAWVLFNGSGTIAGSFNVSSVTVTSTGWYSIAFTTAMPSANYSVVAGTGDNSTSGTTNSVATGLASLSTSGFVMGTHASASSSSYAFAVNTVTVFSS